MVLDSVEAVYGKGGERVGYVDTQIGVWSFELTRSLSATFDKCFFGGGDYVVRTVSGATLEISALLLFHIKTRG